MTVDTFVKKSEVANVICDMTPRLSKQPIFSQPH